MPATVDVSIIGAVVNISKLAGTLWDGGTPPQASLDAVSSALLASTPLGMLSEVVSAIGSASIAATAKPDAFGSIELAWQGPFDPTLTQSLPTAGGAVEDSYTPDWPDVPKPGWINIPYSVGLKIRISLIDRDVANDDSIGTAEINATDIEDAYFSNQVWPVLVDDQTSGQLLFVKIAVVASAPPPPCNGDCSAGTYSECSCAASDPCAWIEDGVCDSACEAAFPGDFFDDAVDCQ